MRVSRVGSELAHGLGLGLGLELSPHSRHQASRWSRNGIPWSQHLLCKAWRSPAILGLQFRNQDTRLIHKLDGEGDEGYERPEGTLGDFSDAPSPLAP